MEIESKQDVDGGFSLKKKLKGLPRWLKVIFILVLVLALGAGGMIYANSNNPVPVAVYEVGRQDLEKTIFTNGTLEAVNQQTFFAPVDSTLMELHVEIGDRVEKGEVLGRLDTLELGRKYQNALAELAGREAELARVQSKNDSLNLETATAAFEKAGNHYDRINQLYQAGAVTEEELEEAKLEKVQAQKTYQEALSESEQGASEKEKSSLAAQVDLCKQEVAQAKERLDIATFTANCNGVVTMVEAREGNRVMEGSELLVVSDDSELQVKADINEIDAGFLELGQEVRVTCLALPGREFKGEIARIGGAAMSKSSNGGDIVHVPVTITLQGDTGDLKIGYTVELTVKNIFKADAITIPVEAIQEREGGKIVFVVNDGIAEEREVVTEIGDELHDAVISGLQEGEKIVSTPFPGLQNGQAVMVPGEGEEE